MDGRGIMCAVYLICVLAFTLEALLEIQNVGGVVRRDEEVEKQMRKHTDIMASLTLSL